MAGAGRSRAVSSSRISLTVSLGLSRRPGLACCLRMPTRMAYSRSQARGLALSCSKTLCSRSAPLSTTGGVTARAAATAAGLWAGPLGVMVDSPSITLLPFLHSPNQHRPGWQTQGPSDRSCDMVDTLDGAHMKCREPYFSCQRINAVRLSFILSVGVLPPYPSESAGGGHLVTATVLYISLLYR